MTFISDRHEVGAGALTTEQAAPDPREVPRLRSEMSAGRKGLRRASGTPVLSAQLNYDVVRVVGAGELALDSSGTPRRRGDGDRCRNEGRMPLVPPLRFLAES